MGIAIERWFAKSMGRSTAPPAEPSITLALHLRDHYSPERVSANIGADSFPTLKLMERVGVVDHPAARTAFVEQKLID